MGGRGALAGDPKDAPKPMDWVEGWRIGQPDAVISMPIEYHVPASGTIDYQYIVIPTGFTEDKYVQLAEARPGNTKLVHHIIAFVREPGNPWMKDAKPGVPYVPKEPELSPEDQKKQEEAEAKLPGIPFPGDFLVAYAPGTVPEVIKPGRAKLIKAGSDLVLQMHYTANGTAGTDISKIGLVFSKTPPTERMLTINTANVTFSIPPGAPGHAGECEDDPAAGCDAGRIYCRTCISAATASSIAPPIRTGEKEVLLSVPHYDFNWQLTLRSGARKEAAQGDGDRVRGAFRQFAEQSLQPGPDQGSSLRRANLGRNDDRILRRGGSHEHHGATILMFPKHPARRNRRETSRPYVTLAKYADFGRYCSLRIFSLLSVGCTAKA